MYSRLYYYLSELTYHSEWYIMIVVEALSNLHSKVSPERRVRAM